MYKYYNANPKNLLTDDCVIRSISVAEGISWNDCQHKLSILSGEAGKVLNDAKFVEDYLDDRYPRVSYGGIRVGDFAKSCPKGHFLVTMNNHITSIIDNVIVDTFDCSDRIIKSCWKVM